MTRRPHRSRGRTALVARPDVALWVLTNNRAAVHGYTSAQLINGYSGEPAVKIDLDGYAADGSSARVGHGLAVLSDGALIIATSQDTAETDAEEAFFYVPSPLTVSSNSLTSALGVPNVTAGGLGGYLGARVCRQLPNGRILLGHRWYSTITRSELEAGNASNAVHGDVASISAGGWDHDVDDSGNVWNGNNDYIWRIPAAQIAAGGAFTPDKLIQGSNVSPSFGSVGIWGIAIDSVGGLWAFDAWNVVARYWDTTAIAAMSGTTSNPAATKTLTSTSFENNAVHITLDSSGGMWCLVYKNPGKLVYFSAAKVAAGGAQTADKVITLKMGSPLTMRLAPGLGVRLR